MAGDASPQNWILTLLDVGAGLTVLNTPTRIQRIPKTTSSSIPGGRFPVLLGIYFGLDYSAFEIITV
jgi:hypothetical protein